MEILSEGFVLPTARGYAPTLEVKDLANGKHHVWYISANSIKSGLEPLRAQNDNRFTGLRIKVRKESSDQKARYEILRVPN